MTEHYDKARTVICPVCEAAAGESCRFTRTDRAGEVMAFPHPARVVLVFPRVEPEEGKELLLTLHVLDDTQRRSYRLDIVTDEESRFAKLTVDQFAALLAGDQIKVQAEL